MTGKYATPTDFQKRLKPERLPMMEADYSGVPPKVDLQYLADRLAIINHIAAYSYLIDEGRWEQWYALFSDDLLLETTAPCFGTIRIKGKEAFRTFVEMRFKPSERSQPLPVRRHIMGNIHVAEQTDTKAHARTYVLISIASGKGMFEVLTSGTYNATLEKRNGKWNITRWYIEIDGRVPKSPIPDIPGIEFIADDRPECNENIYELLSSYWGFVWDSEAYIPLSFLEH